MKGLLFSILFVSLVSNIDAQIQKMDTIRDLNIALKSPENVVRLDLSN
jgi:hypothetical protein